MTVRKVLAIAFLTALASHNAQAEVMATTADGQKVILNDDGTWVKAAEDQEIEAVAIKAVEIFRAYKEISKTEISLTVADCLRDTIKNNSGEKFPKITSPLPIQWEKFVTWIDSISMVNGKVVVGNLATGMLQLSALNQIALSCGMPPT